MLSRSPERSEGVAKNLNACQRKMLRLRLSMTGGGGAYKETTRSWHLFADSIHRR